MTHVPRLAFFSLLALSPCAMAQTFASYEEFRIHYGLLPGTEHEDPDGDGCSNLEEYYFGTNPGVPDCHQPVTVSLDHEAREASIDYEPVPGRVDVITEVLRWSEGEWVAVAVDPRRVDGDTARHFAEPIDIRDNTLWRLRLRRVGPGFGVAEVGPAQLDAYPAVPGVSMFRDDFVPVPDPLPFPPHREPWIIPPWRDPGNAPAGSGPGHPPVRIQVNQKSNVIVACQGPPPLWIDDSWEIHPEWAFFTESESGPVFFELVFAKTFPAGVIELPGDERPTAAASVVFVHPQPFCDPIPISNPENPVGCPNEVLYEAVPPYELDMRITPNWASQEDRDALIEEVREGLSRVADGTDGQADIDGMVARYGPGNGPTSASAFWVTNHIGGHASAYANARLYTDGLRRSVGIWETEEMNVQAGGRRTIEMTFRPDHGCSAVVIGATLMRLRAHTHVFDAVAGSRPEESLAFLRGVNYAGTAALQYLVHRGRGGTKKFAEFMTDRVLDDAKTAVTEAVFSEIKANVEGQLQQLVDEMGLDISIDDIELDSFELPDLKALIEEHLGISIPDPGDLELKHLAFNLVSNTYATANGFMVANVGTAQGTVRTNSRALYLRQAFEDRDQAVNTTGTDCQTVLVVDAQPNSLRAELIGQSAMSVRARGNGHAKGKLESQQVTMLVGICFCGGQYFTDVVMDSGWYMEDKDFDGSVFGTLQDRVDDAVQEALGDGTLTRASSLQEMASFVGGIVTTWANDYKLSFDVCRAGETSRR